MDHRAHYIRYLNLPLIPDAVINRIDRDYNRYSSTFYHDKYVWSEHNNHLVNRWCQENICNTMYWGFQIMSGDVAKHRDAGTTAKLTYLIDTGGEDVHTIFYDDSGKILQDEVIKPNRWHILDVGHWHSVSGVEPGRHRFSVSGRVFGERHYDPALDTRTK